jgi:hypothetical protein
VVAVIAARTRCDMCLLAAKPGRAILRFNLLRQTVVGGVRTTRGAGSLMLCEDCWTRTAKTRTVVAVKRRRARDERQHRERLARAGIP